jgi:hypothetical protein
MFSWLLVRDENLFSSNMSNGESKNSFHSGFKNVYLITVKSSPKKVVAITILPIQNLPEVPENSVLGAKFYLGALFTKVKCTFLKSI